MRKSAALLLLASSGGVSTTACSAHAQSVAQGTRAYHIHGGELGAVLNQFSEQSGLQVLFDASLVKGLAASSVEGNFTSQQALSRLLAGTALQSAPLNDRTVIIKRGSPPAGRTVPNVEWGAARGSAEESVVVTGSRIRGARSASPTVVINSIMMREEGFTNMGEVIRSVSQNFAGGQNPGLQGGFGGVANQNITGGSGLNLRGLGPDATLTLLNGRRLSYGGYVQAVDISAIPIEAVDRLEIVPDGSSAIYGSDAVGGVANVVLKRDFEGLTLGGRYGGATDGGLTTSEFTATGGSKWSNGGFLATFKHSHNTPIYASQRKYSEYMYDPDTLYPMQDSYNGLLSAHQKITKWAELHLDFMDSHRDQRAYLGRSNHYYDYPTSNSNWLVSPSVTFSLPRRWSLTLGGTVGHDTTSFKQTNVLATSTSLYSGARYNNGSNSVELGAEGPLFKLFGHDVRSAVGGGERTNSFQSLSLTSRRSYGGSQSARYAYGELNVPLISPASQIPGAQRLEFSAAGRMENYDSFGTVATPKIGLVYDPTPDFTLSASWGKSFKAPTPMQLYSGRSAYYYNASNVGGSRFPAGSTVLMSYGGNPDLKPERARSWTASLDFHPRIVPRLKTEFTYFDIDYTDRVVQPIADTSQALSSPTYAPFVSYSPTAAEQAVLLQNYGDTFYNQGSPSWGAVPYDASKVVAVINDQYLNAQRQKIRGVDVSGSYPIAFGASRLTIRASGTWLDSRQQVSSGQSLYAISGVAYFPAKYKGRAGGVWSYQGFSVSGFVNYISGVNNTLTTSESTKISSFTTVDFTLNYDTGSGHGLWSRVMVQLAAQNLFDRHPPLYNPSSTTYIPYDSTNYSAIGRFLSFSLAKHF